MTHSSRWLLALAVGVLSIAGCYASHPALPPACEPGEPTVALIDDACDELVVDADGELSCGEGERLIGRGVRARAVNATVGPAFLDVRLEGLGFDPPPGYSDIDEGSCECAGVRTIIPGALPADCIGRFPIAPGETLELVLHGPRNRYRMRICPAPEGPLPLCN